MPLLFERYCTRCKSKYYGTDEDQLCDKCIKHDYLEHLKGMPIKDRLEMIEKQLYEHQRRS